MGKRLPSKATVQRNSCQQMPCLDGPGKSFREAKRRSIVAGLRMMKAPAVLRLQIISKQGQGF